MTPAASALVFAFAYDRTHSFGLDSPAPMRDAAGASAFVMIALIAFLCIAILVHALIIRHRSLHPTPENSILTEVTDELEQESKLLEGSPRAENPQKQPWEKSDDWWKTSPDA